MTEDQIKASAINHYNQDRAKHDLGQYAAAITDYNTVIWLKPNLPKLTVIVELIDILGGVDDERND